MFVLYLSLLLLTEFLWSTEGALSFTQHPPKTVYFRKGQDAVLKWDYSAGTGDIRLVIWSAGLDTVIFEDDNGTLHTSPDIPQAYVGRVKRIKPATLVVETLTNEDAGSYSCTLKGQPGVSSVTSEITLVVTSVEPRAHAAEVDGSVTFTCKATSVPGQNFTWVTRLPNETIIASDARHTIVSASGSSQLTIINITVADQGFYDCVATIGSHQQEFGSGFLQLPKGVTMCTTEVYHVSVGSRLSLSCSPDSGYPIPIVTWEKNGTLRQKEQNNTYTIANVTEEDFGNYTCTAAGSDTSVGPCNKSVVNKVVELVVTPIDGTADKPAKLVWTGQAGAKYYVVQISGNDILDDVMVGTQTYLEVHYHTLVMRKDQHQPEQTEIRAEVLAINNNQVIGITYQELTIKKPSDTKN